MALYSLKKVILATFEETLAYLINENLLTSLRITFRHTFVFLFHDAFV